MPIICASCKNSVTPRRKVGVGTAFLFVFTCLLWIFFIPCYRKRCPVCGTPTPNSIASFGKFLLCLAGFLFTLGLIGTHLPQGPSTAAPTADVTRSVSEAKQKPEPAEVMPTDEERFIAVVQQGTMNFKGGSNEMMKGAARPRRAGAVCSTLGTNLVVHHWVGTVDQLSSNSDGKGVLSVRISSNALVKTWNNALSDIADDTLLDPNGQVFSQAVALSVGQRVAFSGQFRRSDADCAKEASLTLQGSMEDPEFIFRFTEILPR
jgi:hypothetical protein